MGKYEKINNFEGPVLEDGENFRFACCDCGLVHSMVVVRLRGKKIGLAFKREKRHTAQLRRRNYGYLQQQIIGKHKMVRVS